MPLVDELIIHLALANDHERNNFFAKLPKHISAIIRELLNKFDKILETERRKALDEIQ